MSVQDERTIGSICVAGAGLVGLSAAIAFARALPMARVTLLDLPADPAALADRLPGSLPAIARFHAEIGVDEGDLVRSGAATHRLGTRFEGWPAEDAPWYQAHGEYGRAAGNVPFHPLWIRARRAGRALPFHAYSAAAMLADAGKFVHPRPEPGSPLATYAYALRLDPERYRERLEASAGALPLERRRGSIGTVEPRADGGVAALVLEDGCRIEADLFLDCAGPAAPILSALSSDFEDWGEWLPCDRVRFGTKSPVVPSSCDVAAAMPWGWRLTAPLPDRLLTLLVSASAFDDRGEPADAIAIRPGRRPKPWCRNVLALGDAAIAIDPLGQANLHLAQSAILRALALLPGRDCHKLELREYNRQSGEEALRMRDFAVLHYFRSGRTEGELWRAMAGRRPPDSLAHTLDQFEERGRLPFYEEETFDKHGWLAALLGMGVLPRAIDPAAAGVDEAQSLAGMARLADQIAALARQAPPYGDYLARMKAMR
jgi:tryptophan halogenase